MWILLSDAFFSIVESEYEKDILVVRARMEEDIPRVFNVKPEDLLEDIGTDYKFRIYLPRLRVAKRIQEEVESIDYTNFKDSISHGTTVDKERHGIYSSIWSILFRWQTDRYGYNRDDNWWNYRSYGHGKYSGPKR